MWLQAASLSYLGIFFGISVVIGLSCGGYLDKRFHTTPVLRIVGVLFGLATGFNELYRIAKRYQRSQQQANAPKAAGDAKEAKEASRDAAANPTPAQDQAPLLVNQTNDAGPAAGSKAESSDEKDQDGDEKAREEDRERKDSWV